MFPGCLFLDVAAVTEPSAPEDADDEAPRATNEFDNIPIDTLVQNVLPFLQERKDWNNISFVNKVTYHAMRRREEVLPPWPNECKWPLDPNFLRGEANVPVYLQHLDSRRPVWSRDGTQIAALANSHWLSNRRNHIHVVDQRLGHVKKWAAHGDNEEVFSIDFGDNFLVSTGSDRHVRKWNCGENYECIADWGHLIPEDIYDFGHHNDEAVLPVRVSPDACNVVILIRGSIRVFDSTNGTISHSITIGDGFYATSLPHFQPDGNSVVFGCADSQDEHKGFVKIWSIDATGDTTLESVRTVDISRGEIRHEMHFGHSREVKRFVNDLAISSDGSQIVSSGTEILLWDVTDEGLEFNMKFQLVNDAYNRDDVQSVALTPCGKYVAVSGGEKFEENFGFLTFFNLSDGSMASSYCFSGVISSIRYSSNGIGLYVWSNKTTINPTINPEDGDDDDDEYQPRTGPLMVDFGL